MVFFKYIMTKKKKKRNTLRMQLIKYIRLNKIVLKIGRYHNFNETIRKIKNLNVNL